MLQPPCGSALGAVGVRRQLRSVPPPEHAGGGGGAAVAFAVWFEVDPIEPELGGLAVPAGRRNADALELPLHRLREEPGANGRQLLAEARDARERGEGGLGSQCQLDRQQPVLGRPRPGDPNIEGVADEESGLVLPSEKLKGFP